MNGGVSPITHDETYELIFSRKAANNPKISFANINDFIEAPEIDQAIRDSLIQYMRDTDPHSLPKNDKGYSLFKWKREDPPHSSQYVPTWSQQYGWGVMRSPWSPKDAPKSTSTTTKPDKVDPELKAMIEELGKQIKDIRGIVGEIKDRI